MTAIGGIKVPETGVRIIHEPEPMVNFICGLPDSSSIFRLLEMLRRLIRLGR